MLTPEIPGPGQEEYLDAAREAAAEFLRGYAPAGRPSLAECVPYALAATEGLKDGRERVLAATRLLGMGDVV